MNIQTKPTFFVFTALLFILVLAACGDSGPKPTPTEARLTIWDFEKVCRQGVVGKAAAYEPAAGNVHPIVLFERDSAGENSYSSMSNILLKLPEPWVVAYDGQPETVELVACITRVSEEFVETCEFEDDENEEKTYLLDVHNASYEVKVFAATTGEEVGSTTLEAAYEKCPMFHMFSEEKEETFAPLEGGDLQAFLEQYVAP
ncbi:MAG: hypothetical protein ACOYYS_11685 [Chloroflexota bacterium]